jgi:hypothetical protein
MQPRHNTILLKHSVAKDRIPKASDLKLGELAINSSNKSLYFKDINNRVHTVRATESSSTPIRDLTEIINLVTSVIWLCFTIWIVMFLVTL